MASKPMTEKRLAEIAEEALYTEYVGELLAEVRRLQQSNAETQAKLEEALDDWRTELDFVEKLESLVSPNAHKAGSIGCTLETDITKLIARVNETERALQRMTDMWEVEYRRAQKAEALSRHAIGCMDRACRICNAAMETKP